MNKYKICGDDSGHDYIVDTKEVDDFYLWVEGMENDDDEAYEKEAYWDAKRIDGDFFITGYIMDGEHYPKLTTKDLTDLINEKIMEQNND